MSEGSRDATKKKNFFFEKFFTHFVLVCPYFWSEDPYERGYSETRPKIFYSFPTGLPYFWSGDPHGRGYSETRRKIFYSFRTGLPLFLVGKPVW